MVMNPELQKRILTGVLGGASLIGLLVYGGTVGISLIITVLSLGMIFEFSEMTLRLPDRLEKRSVLLILSSILVLGNSFFPGNEYFLFTFAFLILFSYFVLTAKRLPESEFLAHFQELMVSVFGVTYLVFLPQFLRKIFDLPFGLQWVLLFLLIVWSGDTGAYFAGKSFGKRKLYPEISPKKTVEGMLGGLASSVSVALVFRAIGFQQTLLMGIVLLAIVVGGVAQLGDLCESFLKRSFNKKDSGSILPGHGGLLDRFDAILFSAPVMYAGIRILEEIK